MLAMVNKAVGVGLALLMAVTGFGCGLGQPRSATAPQGVDLSGSWELNYELSDNAREVMEEMRNARGRNRQGGGFGGVRPGGGRPGMGGRRGGGVGGGEMDPELMRRVIDLIMRPPQRLSLVQGDTTVGIVHPGGQTLILHPDGRKQRLELEGAGEITIKAHWDGNYLVVERELRGGAKLRETYFRSPTTGQMNVAVRLEMGRMQNAIELRRVYDRVGSQ